MAPDPLDAALSQLTATRDYLTELDAREAAHHTELHGQLTQLATRITAISRTMAEGAASLTHLEELRRQGAELAQQSGAQAADSERYQPHPPTPWWKLPAADRQAPLTELRDWADHVYRPGYGHLAAPLAACWAEHDLCLYALDIASQLWCVLYLRPTRTPALLTAQAEYQTRILPALAAQMTTETTRCAHHPVSYPRSAS